MIVLLNCFTSWSKGNSMHIPFTGEQYNNHLTTDSVLVSYNDLRVVNAKLIELDYQKEINKKLYDFIYNDSLIISNYKLMTETYKTKCNQYKKERNIAIGGGSISLILLILSLIK